MSDESKLVWSNQSRLSEKSINSGKKPVKIWISKTKSKCLILVLISSFFAFCRADEIVGNVRIGILSPTLVRIELKGPKGFEDRRTFHITGRTWPGADVARSSFGDFELIKTSDFIVKVPSSAISLENIVITDPDGAVIWSMPSADAEFFSNNRYWFPNPNENTRAWAFADTPRYVPASSAEAWGGGYNLAPPGNPNNGWDLDNDSRDVYVFLPGGDGRKLRSDYVALTGRTELIPLYALGGWDSRYYAYTQQEALDKIDTYRAKNIPLDVFVVDTDWRTGASHGYGVNTTLFPDMKQFIHDAHKKNVRIVFNDHPEPRANALDAAEVQYRNKGLRGAFDMGLDFWWYDRNWSTSIRPPGGINKEVFGMYLYHWITQDYYPDRRPLIMANVDGIDNGYLNRAPDIAAHRYTLQWTGDTSCDAASLQREIRNAVYAGVYGSFAYVSTDLGGHVGMPTTEQYCRWVQFGAMSPVFRLHCTKGVTRDPWAYDAPAEEVVRDYVQMRMRLLPVFYAAAKKNFDTGQPILKRCDLNYPGYAEAESDYQYLIGDDILVAPVLASGVAVPLAWLDNGSGSAGLTGTYFANKTLSGTPVKTQTDATVDFNWGNGTPQEGIPGDNFSVRWTGNITIKAGHDVSLGIVADDGYRLWIDNVLVIDKWIDQAETTYWTSGVYHDGRKLAVKIEYYENGGQASCRLLSKNADPKNASQRELWIPPGTWTDVWTGNTLNGPQMHTASVSLKEMPIFVKAGAIIPLAPDMAYTGQKAWDPITLDVYPGTSQTSTADLYEDDGVSNDYKSGGYRNTQLQAYANTTAKKVVVTINPAQGTYKGALAKRSWRLRLHTATGRPGNPESVTVDGVGVPFNIIPRDSTAMPFKATGGSPDGDVIEVEIASASVSGKRTIEVGFTSLTAGTFTDDGGTVTLKTSQADGVKTYTLSTTAQLRDNEPADKTRSFSEHTDFPHIRSGNEMFDALYALTLDDARLNAVDEIRDGSFEIRDTMNRPYFQTGEKWTYVWTRDISYSVDLGMASLDPQRCVNSLLFKTTRLKRDIKGQFARQIVQDTGSGGSYPVSTDRVVWAIGAAKLLHFLDGQARTKFLEDAWQIMHDTIEHDRKVIFDPEDGLYRGEQSFLDWREQTYPGWTKDNVLAIAKSKTLSTNIGHYQLLKTAAVLAREKGLPDKTKRYTAWADALKIAINKEFYLESKGLYCSIILVEPVTIKLNRFDLLGQSLAVLCGIADNDKSEKIIANYPQGRYGPPVVWPQEKTVPIYHNQAIWPFVTAYWLKAAKAAGNSTAVDHAVHSLVRGTALNLSNMENFDFVTGQAFAKVNGIEGPVINSRRQLWSVAGYMAMVQDVIFGMETTSDGIRFLPCITTNMHRNYFKFGRTIELRNFTYRGKSIQVTIHLPAWNEQSQGIYTIDKIILNNKPVQKNFIPAGKLEKNSHWEIQLAPATNKAADKINRIDQKNPKSIFGPKQPQWQGDIAVENGKLKLRYDAEGETDVRFNIYRNGQICAKAITETQWTDPQSSADKTCFYRVEAFYPGSDNCSHVTPVNVYCPQKNRIQISATAMKNTGGNLVDNDHFENWGKSQDKLQVDSFTVQKSGCYLFSVKYSNGAGPINTGVACGVKRIEIADPSGKSVAAAYLIMPHTADWKRYLDSSTLEADVKAGINYTIKIFEDPYARNMSYFDHYEPYRGLGNGMTPCNYVNIVSLEAIRIN
jgi:hypothetical protein